MLMTLSCTYKITEYIGKILPLNFERLPRKLQKNLSSILFSCTLYILHLRYMCATDCRAKDAKVRECFEKMFPELKKQREDKERLLG